MLAYRGDFLLNASIRLAQDVLLPLVTVIVYAAGLSFPGWNFYEALLIQAVFMMCVGVSQTSFFGLTGTVMWMVREGTFDLVLIKPRSVMLTSVSMSFNVSNINTFIAGAAFFAFSLAHMPAPSLINIVTFMLLFAAGVSALLGCCLFMAATAFKWVGNGRIFEIFDSVTAFGRYPVTIYPKWLRTTALYAIPVAVTGFVPAAALLGKTEAGHYFAVLTCAAFLAAGMAVYRLAVRNYSSAGG